MSNRDNAVEKLGCNPSGMLASVNGRGEVIALADAIIRQQKRSGYLAELREVRRFARKQIQKEAACD